MTPADIFIQGRLEMSSVPLPEAVQPLLWGDLTVNRILVAAAVLLSVAGLREMFRLLPELAYAFTRPRACVSLEYNTSIARIRNMAALVSVLPFCLIADRFGLFRPSFWELIPAEWSTAATVGVMFSYLLLRLLCGAMVHLPRVDASTDAAVRKGPWSHFILMTILMLATVGLLGVCGVPDSVLRPVLYCEMLLSYLLSLLRTGQILAGSFSVLTTILYLCALEFLPTAVMAACAVFL